MSKQLSTVAAALASAVALPALRQIPVPPPPPLPNLEVRIVAAEPPPPRREVILYEQRPGTDYVWVNGSYDWQGDAWVWVPGRWELRPAPRVTWVRPHYVRVEEGWRYEPAHWSNQKLIVTEKVKVKKEKVKFKKVKPEKKPKFKD
jgi:hypothetical protein